MVDRVSAYLDRTVINQEAVQGLEGLAGSINLAEGDGGDATADATGAV